MKITTPSYILNKAADLLEIPGVLIQGFSATRNDGLACSAQSDKACHFCILGVLEKITGTSRDGVINFDLATAKLRSYITENMNFSFYTISDYNDYPGRTVKEVVKTLREVAKEQNV